MIRQCTDDYWRGMELVKPENAPCGKMFDDTYQLTYCPHEHFPSRTYVFPSMEHELAEAAKEDERREIEEGAKVIHDEEMKCNCDRKYLRSCGNYARAILEFGSRR